MKIIVKSTKEIVAEITGGKGMTLDEAIDFVGEFINDANDGRFSDDGDNVIIDGERYWYEDLDYVVDEFLDAINDEDDEG